MIKAMVPEVDGLLKRSGSGLVVDTCDICNHAGKTSVASDSALHGSLRTFLRESILGGSWVFASKAIRNAHQVV